MGTSTSLLKIVDQQFFELVRDFARSHLSSVVSVKSPIWSNWSNCVPSGVQFIPDVYQTDILGLYQHKGNLWKILFLFHCMLFEK